MIELSPLHLQTSESDESHLLSEHLLIIQNFPLDVFFFFFFFFFFLFTLLPEADKEYDIEVKEYFFFLFFYF